MTMIWTGFLFGLGFGVAQIIVNAVVSLLKR